MRGSTTTGRRGRAVGSLLVFLLAFAFYLALARSADAFTLVTGAISATLVAVVFGGLAFDRSPSPGRTTARLLRAMLAVPLLFWEILKASVAIAALALRPSMPLDPDVSEYETDLDGDLPKTTFALSVTLTPGTLVLDAQDRTFHVHSLTTAAIDDLQGRRLERMVANVFGAAGDAETTDVVRPEDATEPHDATESEDATDRGNGTESEDATT